MKIHSAVLALVVLCCVCLLSINAQYTAPAVVKVGVVLPLTGPTSGAGFRAWMLMNQSLADLPTLLPGILPNTQFQLVVADSQGTLAGTAAAVVSLSQQGVAGLIGGSEGLNLLSNHAPTPWTDRTGVGIGPGSSHTSMLSWTANSLPEPLNFVAISSFACTSRQFSDKTLYPTLVRMCVKQSDKAKSMFSAFKSFGWKKVAILSQDSMDGWGTNSMANNDPVGDTLGPGQSESDYIVNELVSETGAELAKENILRLRLPSNTLLANAAIPDLLQQLKDSGFRIVVVYIQGDLLVKTLRLAHSLEMMQYPYVWIGGGSNAGPASTMGLGTGTVASGGMGPGLCSSSVIQALADLTPNIPSVDASAGTLISTFQSSNIGAHSTAATYVYQADLAMNSSPLLGSLCFSPAAPHTTTFTNLKYKLAAKGLTFDSVLNNGDASAYDSVLVYAKAFDTLIKNQANFTASGIWSLQDVFNAVTTVDLPTQGLELNLKFDSVGDRIGEVEIHGYDPFGSSTGGFVRRGLWSAASNNITFVGDAIIWSDGSTNLPPDHVDRFNVDQVISPQIDNRVTALSYAFVLLPSFVFFYNTRNFVKSFVESNGGEQDKQWMVDAFRALVFFSIPGIFAMIHLNILSISFATGAVYVTQAGFAGGIVMALTVFCFIVFLPIMIEVYWHMRKNDTQTIVDDYELNLEDGEEIVDQDGTQDKNAKKQAEKEAARLAKEKARAARAKAKSGALTRDDKASFFETEYNTIIEKTSPGLAVSTLLFASLFSALFYESMLALILPMKVEIDGGKAFGCWILQVVLLHIVLVRAFKDSRHFGRVFGALLLPAVLLLFFHANMSCLTFKFQADVTIPSTAVDAGMTAIAHAIIFAIPFFAGLLQLIKALKLSRHSLDSILIGMKVKLALMESNLEQAKEDRKQAAADADHLKRLLELSNLCRPLHRNHALAFTMAETTSGAAADGTPAKPFVPASLMQDNARGGGGASIPGTPVRSNTPVHMAKRGLAGEPSAVGVSGVRLDNSAPNSPAVGGMRKPSYATGAGTTSQGITAATLQGLDFSFLARPKAEQTGYKLLNELSLELFLASGPVQQRAIADIHLSHILSHPITLEIFKDSLTRSSSQETLAFWLDIQRFQQLQEEGLRRTVAEAMVATFLYSDAPYPLHSISAHAREHVLNIMFAKKAVKANTFQFIEKELLATLQKEFANFVTTTGFKVCAFLLGHSSYRPSTRIKTLNPGGAVVGDGGKLVPMTQVHAAASALDGLGENSNLSAQQGVNDDGHSVTASNLTFGGAARVSQVSAKQPHASPKAATKVVARSPATGTTAAAAAKSSIVRAPSSQSPAAAKRENAPSPAARADSPARESFRHITDSPVPAEEKPTTPRKAAAQAAAQLLAFDGGSSSSPLGLESPPAGNEAKANIDVTPIEAPAFHDSEGNSGGDFTADDNNPLSPSGQ